MIVLGINCYHANSSAALVVDGKLIFAIEEERLNRVKNSGGFPMNSILECLKFFKIGLDKIDFIAINSDPKKFFIKKIKFSLGNMISFNELLKKSKNISKKINLKSELEKIKNFGSFKGKIINIEHHLSHIASSYYVSNFEQAVGVSIDGSGDFTTTSNSICSNGTIRMKDRIFYPHSLGILYTAISNFLGFDKYGEEYKVMALGAYGNSSLDSKLENIIDIKNDGKFKLKLDFFHHHKNVNTFKIENNEIIISELINTNKLEELLKLKKRDRKDELCTEHFNLAKSLQNLFEKAYFNYLNFSYNKINQTNLCLAGGCAMNSLANGKILSRTKFKKIHIQPAAYDAGGAIGAALHCSVLNGQKINKTHKENLYLGPRYSNNEIKNVINIYEKEFHQNKIRFKYYENSSELIEYITSNLIDKKIIGFFRGNLEWGARALGNRSIIADPRGDEIKDLINKKIKRRESFRPFAPIVLSDFYKEWFLIDKEIPTMMEVHKIRPDKKNKIPAVVHKDETCRLQTINKKDNEFFYRLLYNFYKKTSIPILLNTSFNENEPIVCKPEEAVKTFMRVNMDILVLEDYILERI